MRLDCVVRIVLGGGAGINGDADRYASQGTPMRIRENDENVLDHTYKVCNCAFAWRSGVFLILTFSF